MRAAAVLPALLLALAAELAAQETVAPVPAVPPTQLGVETLARCTLVAVVRTTAVRSAGPGADLVKVRVLERMRGTGVARDDELLVLAARGSLRFGAEDLLFLRPWREGGRHEIVQRIGADEPHYEERLAIVRRSLWLLEVADAQRRADATLDLLLELLASDKDWTRGYAIAELRWMARHQRWLFTEARIARLRSAGRVSPRADVRSGVDSVTSLLTSPAPHGDEAAATEQSRP